MRVRPIVPPHATKVSLKPRVVDETGLRMLATLMLPRVGLVEFAIGLVLIGVGTRASVSLVGVEVAMSTTRTKKTLISVFHTHTAQLSSYVGQTFITSIVVIS